MMIWSHSNGCNGVIIRDPQQLQAIGENKDDLSNFLKTKNISGIYGIDTKKSHSNNQKRRCKK